ncbi:MAG TPA: ABC transporter permease [Puia sp.]|nr:ABC transporter permease [Puia sp.]
MFQNYFRVMVRNLSKNKGYTLINLFGLATGVAVCMLLTLYIQSELGYDEFQDRGDQIFRLALERKYPTRSAFIGQIPRSIGEAVKREFPEVLESVRIMFDSYDPMKVIVGDKTFIDNAVFTADSNFFNVFSSNFLEGDKNTALQKPLSVVLNETTAKRFFGSAANALGKEIDFFGEGKFLVTGVCEDWPAKSHFNFDILGTTSGLRFMSTPEYVYFGPYTYLLLNKNASAAALEKKLQRVVDKYVAPVIPGLFQEPYDKFLAEGNGYRYFLQPLKDIHLHSQLEAELKPVGNIKFIRIFGGVALFILVLACVNFVNLSTALSVERAKEVGIRKTFGSQRAVLVRQFLTESILFSFASMILALLLAFLLTPLLNKVAGQSLTFLYLLEPIHLLFLVAFAILLGLVAGIYPAMVLSAFDPIEVLKGRFRSNRRGIMLRNALVVFQFAVSVILIICTITVDKQMQYMLGDSLGFRKDAIVSVDGVWRLFTSQGDKRSAFLDEILAIPGVESVTRCDGLPGSDNSQGGATWVSLENRASRTDRLSQVDDHYASLLGLQLKGGRFFSKQFKSDSLAVVLNEAAVADFGLKNPIGSRITCLERGLSSRDSTKPYIFTVIGVVRDYHFQSLYKKIAPLIIVNSNKFGWGTAGVSIAGNQLIAAVNRIEKAWKKYAPDQDFRFSFLDEALAAQYKTEQTEQKIFTIFSLLAIVIASVGLLGLSAYTIRQRFREISIRKVLGAMPARIVFTLTRDFLLLVGIASLVAFPIAWWAMHQWMENFAYRTGISWWIFLLAGLSAALIAMLTIGYQAIKAARLNPAKTLKAE